jgi:Tol biopolymer transport system component
VADPSFVPGDRGIVFSVSTSASSRIYLYDLDTNGVRTMLSHQEPVARPSVSPDKSRIVFASPEMGSWHTGAWQIWVADSAAGQPTRLTGGNCNNSMPAWDSASDQIIFASDCGRGLGLPALYRTGHIAGPVPRFPE